MVLTAPPPPVDALPFHGAHDWQAAARPASTGDVAVAGPSSPYSRPPPGLRRKLKRGKRRGDPDSWGTRPIDLYWNGRVRKTSPTAVEEPGLGVSWGGSGSVRRAAARLESSTALIHGRGPKVPRGAAALPRLESRSASPPREGSPRPHPAHNIPRFNASPALAQQQASPRALDAPELDWNELPVSASSFPANSMKIRRAKGKKKKEPSKKPLPHDTMQWLATRHRQHASEKVQDALDDLLMGDPKPPPPKPKKKKKKRKTRAQRERAKRRALKRKQALELQQAATRGVELEVERWAAADRVRGKEMVTQEGFLTWHAKWTDGGAPTEDEWQDFFDADTDGDGVLSHAEFREFAEARGRGVSAEREQFFRRLSKVGARVRARGDVGVVVKKPDEDNDVLVRWDKDNTETFVKRIELRYEDMAEAHLFFYQPDSELEFITLNQTAIANRNMEELQAKHAAALAEAAANEPEPEPEPSDSEGDDMDEFASYVRSVGQFSTPDLAGWAPLADDSTPGATAHGDHAAWRASLSRSTKGGRPSFKGVPLEVSLSWTAAQADAAEIIEENSAENAAAIKKIDKIPLSLNDSSISRHPVDQPTKAVLAHLKRSGVPRAARKKLKEALEQFDEENPPAEKLEDWRLATEAEGRDETATESRPPSVMDPQARSLLLALTPKKKWRAPPLPKPRQKHPPPSPALNHHDQIEPPPVELDGQDARSVFALRHSGRYHVGAIAYVQWERGWYAVVIEEVGVNRPCVRISYLPPYDAYAGEWKHFWEVHFDEDAAKGAAATRTASAQRVAMYRTVRAERLEKERDDAHCREFAAAYMRTELLQKTMAAALGRKGDAPLSPRPEPAGEGAQRPWMNAYAKPGDAEAPPVVGKEAADKVVRPWNPLPQRPPTPPLEEDEEPWSEEERKALLANCKQHGADNWEQRAFELGTRRPAMEVKNAYAKFYAEEQELELLRAKLEAEAEARRRALDEEAAQRLVEEAQALQLFDEAAESMERGDFKRAYEALVPAAALAPEHAGIQKALAAATEKYEAWLKATEAQRRAAAEAKARREKALQLAATKASHPMQWAVFRQIDTSGDGLLQADEIRAYMTELGQPEMATQLLQALDRDGDGECDFPEFCAGWERWLAANTVGSDASKGEFHRSGS